MDPRLLGLYSEELAFIRDSAAEFSREYPRVARRLSLDEQGESGVCPDPYVERLLEGFAFLSARIRLKINSRYPELSHHILENCCPSLLAPIPSATILAFTPDKAVSALPAGYVVKRGVYVDGSSVATSHTPCRFRIAHDVTLLPLEVSEARYFPSAASLSAIGLIPGADVRAGIRIRLRPVLPATLSALQISQLSFYVRAPDDIASRLQELILSNASAVTVCASGGDGAVRCTWKAKDLVPVGLEQDEALLPLNVQSFDGYRLLQEYFLLPERSRFFKVLLGESNNIPSDCSFLDLIIELNKAEPVLDRRIDESHFRLHCVPAVNLFAKSVDRVRLDRSHIEQAMVVDRSKQNDFEIYQIERVRGYLSRHGGPVDVLPVYGTKHASSGTGNPIYYSLQRYPKVASGSRQRYASRGKYVGTECYLSLGRIADEGAGDGLMDIDVDALCTNRDLPLLLGTNADTTRWTVEGAAPIARIQCLVSPTTPRSSLVFAEAQGRRDAAWLLISHLTLNQLSLSEADPNLGAKLLRDILTLHANSADAAIAAQIEGLRRVEYRPTVMRLHGAGPIAYGRGTAIDLHFDDAAFEGLGFMSLAMVLDRFLARQATINSVVQMTVHSTTRGEIKRLLPRAGVAGVI